MSAAKGASPREYGVTRRLWSDLGEARAIIVRCGHLAAELDSDFSARFAARLIELIADVDLDIEEAEKRVARRVRRLDSRDAPSGPDDDK